MTAAQDIAAFAAKLDLGDIPQAVRDAATLHLIDALGVGLASSVGAEHQGWRQAVLSSTGTATCLGGGTATPSEAAMLNGALIHALEYDDTHTRSVIHGSAVAAPVALAASESRSASGAEFLLGYIIAWEVMIRIGLAAPGVFQAHGFQVTSVAGAIGSAAAAGRAYGLPAPQIAQAIGIAGSQASGLLAFLEDGSTVKALNPGWAAQTGLMAATLAAAGMTGPPGILDGPKGLMQVFAGGQGDLSRHIGTLGQTWHLPEAAFKLYPCCHYVHPFLEATERLMAEGLRAAQVKRVVAEVASGQAPLICEPWSRRQAPVSGYDGKWGLAYCIALMLETGRVDVASFEASPREDTVALARRIDWCPMDDADFPRVFPAKLTVETTDGRWLTAAVADVRGTSVRPVDPDLIEAKFRKNAGRCLSDKASTTLLNELKTISEAADLSVLSSILRRTAVARPQSSGRRMTGHKPIAQPEYPN